MDCKEEKTIENVSFDEELLETLKETVPNKVSVKFPENKGTTTNERIAQANAKAGSVIDNAKIAILNSYAQNEETRIRNQKPLLLSIGVAAGLQLLVFNTIIFFIVILSFRNGDTEILNIMFEIFKYYIGATIVELIAMISYITTITFSRDHIKIMKFVFDDNVKNKMKDSE